MQPILYYRKLDGVYTIYTVGKYGKHPCYFAIDSFLTLDECFIHAVRRGYNRPILREPREPSDRTIQNW